MRRRRRPERGLHIPHRAGGAPRPGAALLQGPVCSTCGRPISRLPSYLASPESGPSRFQCQACFYPGPAPRRGPIVATDQTRWWREMMEGDSLPSSPPAGSDEDA